MLLFTALPSTFMSTSSVKAFGANGGGCGGELGGGGGGDGGGGLGGGGAGGGGAGGCEGGGGDGGGGDGGALGEGGGGEGGGGDGGGLGGGGDAGGMRGDGGGGGTNPQVTTTLANAASPLKGISPSLRVYLNANDGELTATVALCHESPCSPLRLHFSSPAALVTLKVPIPSPYMW